MLHGVRARRPVGSTVLCWSDGQRRNRDDEMAMRHVGRPRGGEPRARRAGGVALVVGRQGREKRRGRRRWLQRLQRLLTADAVSSAERRAAHDLGLFGTPFLQHRHRQAACKSPFTTWRRCSIGSDPWSRIWPSPIRGSSDGSSGEEPVIPLRGQGVDGMPTLGGGFDGCFEGRSRADRPKPAQDTLDSGQRHRPFPTSS